MYKGFGKIILFGEHFVVYGLPGIVVGLPLYTTASVEHYPVNEDTIIDARPYQVVPQVHKAIKYKNMLKAIAESFGLDKPIAIKLAGTLPVCSGGVGSSAAAAVAITRALAAFCNQSLTQARLETIALHGEHAVHGKSSGIDIVAAIQGRLLSFCNDGNQIITKPLICKKPLYGIVADTLEVADTAQVIEIIAAIKKEQPDFFALMCIQYRALYDRAVQALESGDSNILKECIEDNQRLLINLGVSHSSIEVLRKRLYALGYFGAKQTGTGLGGVVFGLKEYNDDVDSTNCFNFFKFNLLADWLDKIY